MKNYLARLCTAILILTTSNNVFAQVYTVGKPIRIGNIEVAQFDYPRTLNWWDAEEICNNVLDGWRLPTEEELNVLFINRVKIGGFKSKAPADWVQGDLVKDFWSTYWTSFTEGRQFARLQYFSSGRKNLGNAYDKVNLRAVRSLTNIVPVINLNAQGKVIGKPLKIGTLEVAQFDFPGYLKMWEAKRACTLIGGGWRLPTKDELNILYENKDKLGLSSDSYWSGTKETNESYKIWGQDLKTGEQKQWGLGSSVKVRAVRVL